MTAALSREVACPRCGQLVDVAALVTDELPFRRTRCQDCVEREKAEEREWDEDARDAATEAEDRLRHVDFCSLCGQVPAPPLADRIHCYREWVGRMAKAREPVEVS